MDERRKAIAVGPVFSGFDVLPEGEDLRPFFDDGQIASLINIGAAKYADTPAEPAAECSLEPPSKKK